MVIIEEPILTGVKVESLDDPIFSTEVISDQVVEGTVCINEYADMSIRQSFISKVYSILWVQLSLTSIFLGLCNQVPLIHNFMISPLGIQLSYLSCGLLFIQMISLFCLYNSVRRSPYNWLFTGLFTILMIYSLGIVGSITDTKTLLLSGLSTLGIFSGLTLYAIQTKVDYTIYGNVMIVTLFGLIIFGFIASFIQAALLNMIYSVGGAVIFSFYIIYDTQLLIGGNNRRIQYTTNDFALASINLYLDVVNLFLFLLDLMSGNR